MSELERLREIEAELTTGFSRNRRVMSFDAFFEAACANPTTHLRGAAQYVRDCFDYYGVADTGRADDQARRHQLFDAPWDGGRSKVVGQEGAQADVYRLVSNFVSEGRVTRLVLLHGPNGSAKSSFIRCVASALEDYSARDEGAIYRFNWIFPSASLAKTKLGFGSQKGKEALASFAELKAEDIDARLPGDLRDHPLLLLPVDVRKGLIEGFVRDGRLSADEPVDRYFLEGDLAPRSRAIVDALLAAYQGDFQRVLQHVQVERFYFSRRYRHGVVTIEPQIHVDASLRQVTMDQGLQALPASLRNLSLYEPLGDLVDANRGLVEFNDLLKKPVDAFKYLLATCEKGTVALPQAILHLNVLFLASSNEVHLRAFKQYADFPSFKGRMDLVKMPYLRNYLVERRIYDEQLAQADFADRTAPHTTEMLALWAVLTRLLPPDPELYPEALREVIGDLTPLAKARLYATGETPGELTNEQARELRALLPALLSEGQDGDVYEGSLGASPREMRQVLLNARQNPNHWEICPLGVFEELEELIKETSVYAYLGLEPKRGYHMFATFIAQVRDIYLDRIDNEVRGAMGLVSSTQYESLFARYILHVSYLLKGEKLYNETTSSTESPDTSLMDELERVWEIPGDIGRFRADLVSRVGAYRVDNRGSAIDYRTLFPKLFAALESDYYEQQRSVIERALQQLIAVLAGDENVTTLDAADRQRAVTTIAALETDYGHPRDSLAEILRQLLKTRY